MGFISKKMQEATVTGFCAAMMISFNTKAEEFREGNNRNLTPEEYRECYIFAFKCRSGWSQFSDDTLIYESNNIGDSVIDVNNLSFAEALFEGMSIEGIFSKASMSEVKMVQAAVANATGENLSLESRKKNNESIKKTNFPNKKIEVPIIQSEMSPRQVLYEDFGKLIGELPIRGGWGYKKEDAVIIDKNDPIVDNKKPFHGVGYEYIFAEYRTYEELIVFREDGDKYCDVQQELLLQEVFTDEDGKSYDCLHYIVSALPPNFYDVWGKVSGMELTALRDDNKENRVWYDVEYWFDITSFYGRGENINKKHVTNATNQEFKFVTCKNCRKEIDDSSKFCNFCGNDMSGSSFADRWEAALIIIIFVAVISWMASHWI